jgi:hypothetical protein
MRASDILGTSDLRTKQVEVPAWGVTLTVREMGLDDGMQFARLMRSRLSGDDVTLSGGDIAGVVARGVVDPETGERVFSDEDIPRLAAKSQKALMSLYMEIVNLSGEVEEAAKN